MGRVDMKTNRVYPVDYMFQKVEELKDLIDNDIIEVKEKTDVVVSQLADRAYYLSSSLKNTDIKTVLQNALNDVTIGSVHIPVGDYLLSGRVVIPAGKEVVLTGNSNSNTLVNSEVSNAKFTKIKPTFNGDYCFELNDRSTIRNGFINCEAMTSGGGIIIDPSQKVISRASVIGTVLSGGYNWGTYGVLINCDRPSGTTPGNAYFLKIDAGIKGFGIGVYLKRQDTYSALDATTSGLVWVVGVHVRGEMERCQRYVFFDTAVPNFAGGSSRIECRMQGGPVPDKTIPAIEIGGDDSVLNCQFHDIADGVPFDQNVRYKLRGTTNAIVLKGKQGSPDIVDTGTNTSYVQSTITYPSATLFTTINNAVTVNDGWYIQSGNLLTVNFRHPSLPNATGWTTIYTLPFATKQTTRRTVLTDSGKLVSIMVVGVSLQVINNNPAEGCNIQFSYPIN